MTKYSGLLPGAQQEFSELVGVAFAVAERLKKTAHNLDSVGLSLPAKEIQEEAEQLLAAAHYAVMMHAASQGAK